jgi:hypothetical protein
MHTCDQPPAHHRLYPPMLLDKCEYTVCVVLFVKSTVQSTTIPYEYRVQIEYRHTEKEILSSDLIASTSSICFFASTIRSFSTFSVSIASTIPSFSTFWFVLYHTSPPEYNGKRKINISRIYYLCSIL